MTVGSITFMSFVNIVLFQFSRISLQFDPRIKWVHCLREFELAVSHQPIVQVIPADLSLYDNVNVIMLS